MAPPGAASAVRRQAIGGRTAFLAVLGAARDGAEVRSSRGVAGRRAVVVDPLRTACAEQAGIADPTDTFAPFD